MCTAAGGTATEWLFPIKPVGPVPPPSSSLDDSKKNEANPNDVQISYCERDSDLWPWLGNYIF